MGKGRKYLIVILCCMITMLLSACRAGTERYELTNYMGKSVKSFERKSGIKLEMLSNGVYVSKDAVQIMEQDNSVTQITLMNKTGEYTVYGVKIGMSKEDADKLLKDTFGTEITKTLNDDHNNTIYSYLKDGKELYITYDNNKNTVTQISYYKADNKDRSNASQDSFNFGEIVAIIGDTKVYYNEAMVYLKSAQANYETEYGKGIWDADIKGNGITFGKMLKDEVINQITELKIIRSEALKQGIVLEEDELAQVDSYAKEHYDGLTQEDKEKYHITEELLKQVYTDNLLADKVFENKTINVNNVVSDLESRQVTVQHILIYSTDFDNTGNKLPLSTQEKEDAYNKIQELFNQAKETNDFYALAEANTQADTIEYTFGRRKGPKEYGEAFEQAAFSLKTGEISNIITTDYGWHIIYCVTDFNEDATIQAKEDIIEQRRYDEFSKVYSNWSKDYDIVINNEVWDTISLQD